MILKEIRQEGRIRIYMMTFIMYAFGGAAWNLPRMWMKLLGASILSFIYLYAVTTTAKKFKYKIQQKCKEAKT